jgi:hypothetical protein
MRVLLGLAALAATLPVLPAQAQSFGTAAFGTPSTDGRHGRMQVHVHRGFPAAYAYGAYGDTAISTATAASIPTSGTTGGTTGRTALIRAG